jgi:hypothetical protein
LQTLHGILRKFVHAFWQGLEHVENSIAARFIEAQLPGMWVKYRQLHWAGQPDKLIKTAFKSSRTIIKKS